MSRLVQHPDHGNAKQLGDRTLAVFLNINQYIFATYDFVTNRPNLMQAVRHQDIEGVWTYIYFSYSESHRKAVGFIKYH